MSSLCLHPFNSVDAARKDTRQHPPDFDCQGDQLHPPDFDCQGCNTWYTCSNLGNENQTHLQKSCNDSVLVDIKHISAVFALNLREWLPAGPQSHVGLENLRCKKLLLKLITRVRSHEILNTCSHHLEISKCFLQTFDPNSCNPVTTTKFARWAWLPDDDKDLSLQHHLVVKLN